MLTHATDFDHTLDLLLNADIPRETIDAATILHYLKYDYTPERICREVWRLRPEQIATKERES